MEDLGIRYGIRGETKRAKDRNSLWHRLGFQMCLRKEGHATSAWAAELGLPSADEALELFGDMMHGAEDQACFGGLKPEAGPPAVESDLASADNAYRGSCGVNSIAGPWALLDRFCTSGRNVPLFSSIDEAAVWWEGQKSLIAALGNFAPWIVQQHLSGVGFSLVDGSVKQIQWGTLAYLLSCVVRVSVAPGRTVLRRLPSDILSVVLTHSLTQVMADIVAAKRAGGILVSPERPLACVEYMVACGVRSGFYSDDRIHCIVALGDSVNDSANYLEDWGNAVKFLGHQTRSGKETGEMVKIGPLSEGPEFLAYQLRLSEKGFGGPLWVQVRDRQEILARLILPDVFRLERDPLKLAIRTGSTLLSAAINTAGDVSLRELIFSVASRLFAMKYVEFSDLYIEKAFEEHPDWAIFRDLQGVIKEGTWNDFQEAVR